MRTPLGIPESRRYTHTVLTALDASGSEVTASERFEVSAEATRQRATRPQADRPNKTAVLEGPQPPGQPGSAQAAIAHIHRHVNRVTRFTQNGLALPPSIVRLTDCSCLGVPATPATRPWLVPVPPNLQQDAVMAVGIIYSSHTSARMAEMVPYLVQRCEHYGITPIEVANTLIALHAIHKVGKQEAAFPEAMRRKALSVALDVYGCLQMESPDQAIDAGRKVDWTRMIAFSKDATMTVLIGVAVTGTLAAGSYMAACYIGQGVAKAKATSTLAGKAGGAAMIAGGTAAAAGLGAATVLVGGISIAACCATVQAYRDVWDNDYSRDAWLFHRMRQHNNMPNGDQAFEPCRHNDGEWTAPLQVHYGSQRGEGWN